MYHFDHAPVYDDDSQRIIGRPFFGGPFGRPFFGPWGYPYPPYPYYPYF
ncbi:hypothetical protein [Bacillus licheniformis]|nr:hypothetical protein [Bacillus licheniformis]KYC75363.1 hypothetical protein B4090_2049 [Bacillus licheniformis]